MDENPRILIVDDDEGTRRTLSLIFGKRGYETETAATGQEALQKAQERFFNLALLDIKLPDMAGVELLGPLHDMHPDMEMLMATAYASTETAVWALNEGASAYITKPLNMDEVLAMVAKALEKQRLVRGKRRAEEALRESERFLKNVFDAIQDGISVLDRDLTVVQTNRWMEKMYAAHAPLVGKKCYAVYQERSSPCPWCPSLLALETGEQHMEVVPYPSVEEPIGWIELTAFPFKDDGGQSVGVIEYVRDITKRVRAEEALRESEERFRRLAENAQDIIFRYRFTPIPGFEYVSPAATAITGYTPEEHYADPDLGLKIVHPDDQSQLEKYFQGEGVFRQPIVLRWVKKDGTVIWTEQRNVPIYDEAGNLVAIEGIARDITERKRAEEALRVSEERFALAVRGSDAGVWDWDIRNNSLYWSPRLKELLGYADDELDIDFDTFESHLHPDDRERTTAAIEAYLKDRGLYHVEQRLRTKSGEYRWFLARGQALWDENGNPVRMVGSTTDITERKRAEEALAHERDLLQALMDNIPDTIYFKDTASRFTRINRAQAQVLGIKDPEEAIGKTDFDFFTEEHAQNAYAGEQEIVKSGQPLIDKVEKIRRADGQIRWVSATKVPILDEKGQVTGIVGISRDITERKRAEEEIRRYLERIEALREVDRAITSTLDFNQVLDIILEELERVIPYHSAAIFLLSDGTAQVAAARGFPDMERVLQISFPVEDDALIRQLLQEKQPLILADAQANARFLARGGTDYVRSWLGAPLMAKEKTVGFLTIDHREPGVYGEESAEMAEAFGSQAAIAIENARLFQEAQQELAERQRAEEELQYTLEKLREALGGIIQTVASTVELKDPYTAGHQRRVGNLARSIANEMGLPQKQIDGVRMAGLIHDLGKIGLPAETLSKPSQLNDYEWGLIQAHPRLGHDILKTVEFPWPVAQIVLEHHERMNGSGYPQGLSGEEIKLEARVLAVADVVEAMSSHRPYRPALGIDKALEEISQNRGILYDSEVVDACLRLFAEERFKFE